MRGYHSFPRDTIPPDCNRIKDFVVDTNRIGGTFKELQKILCRIKVEKLIIIDFSNQNIPVSFINFVNPLEVELNYVTLNVDAPLTVPKVIISQQVCATDILHISALEVYGYFVHIKGKYCDENLIVDWNKCRISSNQILNHAIINNQIVEIDEAYQVHGSHLRKLYLKSPNLRKLTVNRYENFGIAELKKFIDSELSFGRFIKQI